MAASCGRLQVFAAFMFMRALGKTIDIQWVAKSYDSLTISVVDEVIFKYSEAHNVVKFDNIKAYNDCDLPRSNLFGAKSDGSYRFAPGIPGTFHFGCSMGSHCASMGQKITITVQASGEGNLQYNQYDTVMAGSKPEESEYFNKGEEILTKTYEVTSSIPGDVVTTYAWIGWDLPTDRDYHIVGLEAIADGAEFLHHYILKLCEPKPGNSYNYPGPGVLRDHRDGVHGWQGACKDQIWAWALGVSYFMAPKDAGFLFGPSANAGKALELGVHYDNPFQKSGEKDTSYLKLYYTPAVRKHNLGVLEIGGGGPHQVAPIPPQRRSFYNAFGVRCKLPQDVTVIGHISHAHLLGRSIVTEKWRLPRSKDQPPELEDRDFGRDPQFFSDNQHYLQWKNTKSLSSGDYLTITCIFDSRGRTETTQGGLATRDEMCINFMIYYPHVGNEECYIESRKANDMPDDYDPANFPSSLLPVLAADGWDGYAKVSTAIGNNLEGTNTGSDTDADTIADNADSSRRSGSCFYLLWIANAVMLTHMSQA